MSWRGAFPSTTGVPTDPINCNENGQQLQYTQEALNTLSFQRRQELGRQATLVRPASAPPGVEVESAFEARWLDGDLVLLRRVRRGDERLLQGTWLDWPALRAFLLGQVAAVAPASSLQPVGERDGADPRPAAGAAAGAAGPGADAGDGAAGLDAGAPEPRRGLGRGPARAGGGRQPAEGGGDAQPAAGRFRLGGHP